jgi:hypothetical protein
MLQCRVRASGRAFIFVFASFFRSAPSVDTDALLTQQVALLAVLRCMLRATHALHASAADRVRAVSLVDAIVGLLGDAPPAGAPTVAVRSEAAAATPTGGRQAVEALFALLVAVVAESADGEAIVHAVDALVVLTWDVKKAGKVCVRLWCVCACAHARVCVWVFVCACVRSYE